MGMAARGRIQQKIYEDTRPVEVYDIDVVERLHVHTLSTTGWEVCMCATRMYTLDTSADNHWDRTSHHINQSQQ